MPESREGEMKVLVHGAVLLLGLCAAGCGTGHGTSTGEEDARVREIARGPKDLWDVTRQEASSPADTPRMVPAELILPPFPWWENDAFVIDGEWMVEQATLWCHDTRGRGGMIRNNPSARQSPRP